MKPELIADYECEIGENPLWHPIEKKIYWSDIPKGKLFRYDPATDKHEQCYEGPEVGGFTIQEDGSLLFFMAKGAVATWKNGKLNYIIKEIPEERETRFNDVITDPSGRVFCGMVATSNRPGRLYRLDTNGSIRIVLENIGIPNGIGFTPDKKYMYYTDTEALKIYIFDYDQSTGEITNQRVFVETPEGKGFPDGMTVDAEGYVWSARWDGWSLYRYAPDGTQERQIQFPVKKVSSVIFGGNSYKDIYVTTAIYDSNKEQDGANAGALFRLRLGIQGVPEFASKICL